ncbi:uncharacterized protein SCHCODRAFT_02641729 [Schizophyllum commune H4-8]|uniref:uncharacterized protein n=1 Tax=Schizophyllum commune (strain H4-8 / FGSC 9210) TaxID=578458 RepID=UPI00215E546B|nr:uncharacterized protein SCHCODRAFT_02641729 [Schizophyllum commune H4-8]KAI5886428.1 hypothetical protein SCHCODRAFT_02641729 [Schizophyllum commune H4-8]
MEEDRPESRLCAKLCGEGCSFSLPQAVIYSSLRLIKPRLADRLPSPSLAAGHIIDWALVVSLSPVQYDAQQACFSASLIPRRTVMALHANTSKSPPRPRETRHNLLERRRPKGERHLSRAGRHRSTAKSITSESSTEGQETEDAQLSSPTSVTRSISQLGSSFTTSPQPVPPIIPNELNLLPASVCASPEAPLPVLPERTPHPAPDPARPTNYFNRHSHHIHLPYPIVAIPMVDEETQTVYFTRAGEVSGDVVYASVWRLPTVGIDVFYLPSNLNPRPLTQRACEIARALGRVVGQVYKHIYRQHMFIQYARYFSRVSLVPP